MNTDQQRETPLTDQEVFECSADYGRPSIVVDADFARTLERSRDELRSQLALSEANAAKMREAIVEYREAYSAPETPGSWDRCAKADDALSKALSTTSGASFLAEMKALRERCKGFAQAALNNGQDLLLHEAMVRDLTSSLNVAREALAKYAEWEALVADSREDTTEKFNARVKVLAEAKRLSLLSPAQEEKK